MDWRSIFALDTPILEIFIRGSIVYLSIFFLFRLVLKRQTGSLGIADILLVVLVADAAQNAMGGDYKSIPDGLFLVAVLAFWSYMLEWMGYRFKFMKKLLHPAPLPLVRNGALMKKNMKQELITEEELMGQLRQQGVDDIKDVKEAFMEAEGHISVVKREK
jgi:uncharacterized membrane protein YcaP (DUF421 family)